MNGVIPVSTRRIKRRGKILYSLTAVMLVAGLLPLFLTTGWLVRRNREELEASERLLQLDQTRSIAQQARLYLQSMHDQVQAIAETFEIGSGPREVRARIEMVSAEALVDFIQEDRVRSITVFTREARFVNAGWYSLDDEAIESSLRQSLVEGHLGQGLGLSSPRFGGPSRHHCHHLGAGSRVLRRRG